MIKFKGKNYNDKIPNGIWMASSERDVVWLVIGDNAYLSQNGVFNMGNNGKNCGWHNTYWIKISIKSYYEAFH